MVFKKVMRKIRSKMPGRGYRRLTHKNVVGMTLNSLKRKIDKSVKRRRLKKRKAKRQRKAKLRIRSRRFKSKRRRI